MKLRDVEVSLLPLEFVYNAIRTPDGTVLHSCHRHDYVSYLDANGETYINDGGNDYARRSINREPYVDISVRVCDDIQDIREYFKWGTFGKNGKEPFKKVLLKDMSNQHIQAIIDTKKYIWDSLFELELQYRKVNNILIEN